MKKILALFLVIAMLSTGLVVFSSCGDESIDADTAKADPYTTLMKASRNSVVNFFFDDDAADIIKAVSKKGSMTLEIGQGDMFGNDFKSVKSSLFVDVENGLFVSEESIDVDKQKIDQTVYSTPDSITVKSSSFDKVLKLNLKDLTNAFNSSELIDLLKEKGIKEKDLKQVKDAVAEVEKNLVSTYADIVKGANEFVTIFMEDVSETEVEVDGESYDCIKIPFTINNSNATKVIETALKKVELPDEDNTLANISNSLKSINDKATFTAYIDTDTTSFVKVDVKATLTSIYNTTSEEDAPILSGTILFGEDRIILNGSFKDRNDSTSVSGEIVKKTDGDVTTFDFSLSAGKYEIMSGKFSYNEETGAVELEGSADDGTDDFELSATFSVADDAITLSIKEVSADDEMLDADIKFTMNSAATAPSAPAGAVDILKDFSDEDWEALIKALNDNYYDDYYDDYYEDYENYETEIYTMYFDSASDLEDIELAGIEDIKNALTADTAQ